MNGLVSRWFYIYPLSILGCYFSQMDDGTLLSGHLSITKVEPNVWVVGTKVQVHGNGFLEKEKGKMFASFEGNIGSESISFDVEMDCEHQGLCGFVVSSTLGIPKDVYNIEGIFSVTRLGDRKETYSIPFIFSYLSQLKPTIREVRPRTWYPGEEVIIEGDGLLIGGKGAEGESFIRLSGEITNNNVKKNIDQTFILSSNNRIEGRFQYLPQRFDFGRINAELVVVNHMDDVLLYSNHIELEIEIRPPFIEKVYPSEVGRGELLRFLGKGFLPPTLFTTTLFRFIGTYQSSAGILVYGDHTPLFFSVDSVIKNSEAVMVVSPAIGKDGLLTGFGHESAKLEGVIAPLILYNDSLILGEYLSTTIKVKPQTQVVYIKFFPSFKEGLAMFGLEILDKEVMNRIYEVCSGDYADFSVEFRLTKPEDIVEYITVEVMGKDPNDAGLLGLDNYLYKDTGNLIFDELIGGLNVSNQAKGYYGYGGVFVESFLVFSHKLNKMEMGSQAFDDIFGHFSPKLGGKPVKEGEYPNGIRREKIAKAIWVLGNIIGDTITHEVGHALGLSSLNEDFHNPGDNPGYIMDAGVFRSFEERAQLPSAPKRIFAPYDVEYLKKILPKK